jgi:hypothetical protein
MFNQRVHIQKILIPIHPIYSICRGNISIIYLRDKPSIKRNIFAINQDNCSNSSNVVNSTKHPPIKIK